jgi:hypothetical protein
MRKIQLPMGELNIVSLLDVLTTLIFFIIMMAGFGDFFSIPTNPLEMGTPPKEKKPVFALKVTIMNAEKIAVWLGPVKDLEPLNKEELKELLTSSFIGNERRGYRREITNTETGELLKELQKLLIKLKNHFPYEMKAAVAIGSQVKFQNSVDTISNVRTLASEEEPLNLMNPLGKHEKTRVLFPEIIISEWEDGVKKL